MGFTRSTTNVSVHQGLSDYPNQDDGLTAAQLKATFDFPAETLQNDLNGLETELEDVSSAANIGADVITAGDESDANVQAKLEKLAADMVGITQGAVADGSITLAKLASSLADSLAVKDGTLQTGLNSQKVGGYTISNIQNYAKGVIKSGTYTGNTTGSTTTNTITVGIQPKLLIIRGYVAGTDTLNPRNDDNAIAIIVGSYGKVITTKDRGNNIGEISVTLSSTGFTLTGSWFNYNNKTYTYVAI